MPREYLYDILPEIKARYSTKHFDAQPISTEQLLPLFEAARYAPSCFNEQPWRFLIGNTQDRHEKLASTLMPGNAWAKQAPVLILVLACRYFKLNGKENAHARFDTGTAGGFLQLEAIRQGLVTHCMSGFDAQQASALFHLPQEYDPIMLIALGRPADLSTLSEEERAQEVPGTRNPLPGFLIGD